MKIWVEDIGGEVVKEDDRYVVKDNKFLKNLVVSSTKLEAKKSTSGHSHAGQEEVYHFIKGSGRIELDDKTINVKVGDIVLIEDGVFHRVHAGPHGCYFICVFDGRRTH
jgi:quercetin dioxygenase-like cupin family protein|tara:strand:+ start:380 stop:706 length:327 start_codon:yes stop_codon:yes gene_type:complete